MTTPLSDDKKLHRADMQDSTSPTAQSNQVVTRVLNLYAGIGGNRKLWENVEVTAVENVQHIADAYQKLYPNDTVIVADAHQYLLDHFQEFDLIWSSPPCPTHSRMRTSFTKSDVVYPDMQLYQEILFLQQWCKTKWVVENVIPYYTPLIRPTAELERHLFWANFHIGATSFQRTYHGRVTDASKEALAENHGITLPEGTKDQRKLLRNAVVPEVGEYILNAAKGVRHHAKGIELVAMDFGLELNNANPQEAVLEAAKRRMNND